MSRIQSGDLVQIVALPWAAYEGGQPGDIGVVLDRYVADNPQLRPMTPYWRVCIKGVTFASEPCLRKIGGQPVDDAREREVAT